MTVRRLLLTLASLQRAGLAALLAIAVSATAWSVEPMQAVQLESPLITRVLAREPPPAVGATSR